MGCGNDGAGAAEAAWPENVDIISSNPAFVLKAFNRRKVFGPTRVDLNTRGYCICII